MCCCCRSPRLKKVRNCLRAVSIGEVNNGLYFQSAQQYLSAVSGLFTVVGLLVVLGLSVKVFLDVANRVSIQTQVDLIDQSENNISNLGKSVFDFEQKSLISFKVKAYSFEELLHEPLACENVKFDLSYVMPLTTDPPKSIGWVCTEVNGALNFTISFGPEADLINLDNSQYVRLDVAFEGTPLVIPGSKLYLLYGGNNYFFTGKQITQIWFSSLELPFGHFYKTQISPFYEYNQFNLWPWGQQVKDVYFTFAEPYFEEDFPDFSEEGSPPKVRIFLKYTNDNNPF